MTIYSQVLLSHLKRIDNNILISGHQNSYVEFRDEAEKVSPIVSRFLHLLSHPLTVSPPHPSLLSLASPWATFLFLCPFFTLSAATHTQHTLHTRQTKKPTTLGASDHNL